MSMSWQMLAGGQRRSLRERTKSRCHNENRPFH
jgi:hypothetical protein